MSKSRNDEPMTHDERLALIHQQYPDRNKDGWPDWIEVDERTGTEI